MPNNTHEIARLNDLCRSAMGIAGKLFQTEGISALPEADQSAIRAKVETFKDFSEDNDPHGERDFGAFEHNGQRIFWKIDYYAHDPMHGSEKAAQSRGVKFGRKPKLTSQQIAHARKLVDTGEAVPEVARLLSVDRATVYRALQRGASAAKN